MSERAPRLLLPVKSLNRGKSRLVPAIGQDACRRLNLLFLHRMAEVATDFPGRAMTTVVSDAEDTLAIAASLGLDTIRHMDGSGLNSAVTQGCTELYARGAQTILILPVDLPQVLPADLCEVAKLGRRYPVVICPDRHLRGTNAIFLARAIPFCFQFGIDSYRRHHRAAEECHLKPFLHFNIRIASDIDLPDDLAKLACRPFARIAALAANGVERDRRSKSDYGVRDASV